MPLSGPHGTQRQTVKVRRQVARGHVPKLPKPKPTGVFKQPVEAPSFEPAQKQAARKVKRAKAKLPKAHVSPRNTPKAKRPTVFNTGVGDFHPAERMERKQGRKLARAVLNVESKGRTTGDQVKVPKRPLKTGEVIKALGSPRGQAVVKSAEKITKPKKEGFELTPAGVFKGAVGAGAAVAKDLPKELEGKGVASKTLAALGAASAKGWASVGAPKIIQNAAKEGFTIPASAVPSIYLPAKDIAEGHPKKAAKTLAEGVKETVLHPQEHPLSLLLIARGGEGAVSRTAGEAARRGVLGKTAKGVVKDERTPLHLGGAALERRKPSKGLLEAATQKKLDKRAYAKRGTTVKVPVREHPKMDESFRGHAIWRNKENDQPVKVTGVAGKHGDTTYMKVEGSGTGVPLHELSAESRMVEQPVVRRVSKRLPRKRVQVYEPKATLKSIERHEREQRRYDASAQGVAQKTWYHGTSAEIKSAGALDASRGAQINNLFGAGVYLTDDPAIARSYAKARASRRSPYAKGASKQNVYAVRVAPEKVLDLQGKPNTDFVSALSGVLRGVDTKFGPEYAKEFLAKVANERPRSNAELYKAFKSVLANANDDFPGMAHELGFELNIALREKGYDAMTHLGGVATKSGHRHQALILLDPSNIANLAEHVSPVRDFGAARNRLSELGSPSEIRSGRVVRVRRAGTRLEPEPQKYEMVQAIKATPRQRTGTHVTGGGKVNRRSDREYATAVQVVQKRRTDALHEFDRAIPKHGQDAIALVNRGVLKRPETVKADLTAYVKQLKAERTKLKEPAELLANQESITRAEGLLKDEKFLKDPQPAFDAAKVYAQTHSPLEAKRVLYGDLAKGEAERRPLLDFAVREMGLRKNEKAGRFETKDGKPVSNEQIVKAFEKAGGNPSNLAFVPLKEDFTGPGNFTVSPARRPGAETKTFTGKSALSGVHESGVEVLRNQLARAATRVARHETTTHLQNTFGLKQSSGKFFDYEGAVREAKNLKAAAKQNGDRHPEEYVPVTAARASAPDTLVDRIDPAEQAHTFHPAEPGDKHVILMPRSVWDRFEAQKNLRPFGPMAAPLSRINRLFRHTVLSTSTRWLTGNSVESYLRMQIHSLTPVQVADTIAAGVKIEKRVRKQYGDQAVERLRATGGKGLYGSQKILDVHDPKARGLSKFVDEWTDHAENLSWMDPKRAVHLWTTYRQAVHALNQLVTEDSVYYFALGKHARVEVNDMLGLMDRALGKAGPAYEAVAKGLTDSNKLDEFARELDKIRGRYSHLSPAGRWFTTVLTPFGNWWVNALYFVYVTLPTGHPLKTALATAASQGTEKRRNKMQLPPWARTSVPLSGGRYLTAEHYTPFGIFQGADTEAGVISKEGALTTLLKNVGGAGGSAVMPQIQGAQMALASMGWTGQTLDSTTSPVLAALYSEMETMVPLVARARTVLERGGSATPESTIFHPQTKPGTSKSIGAGFEKAFNPAHVSGQKTGLSDAGRKLLDSQSNGSGNRFLQSSGSNKFLRSGSSGNRFLQESSSSNRFLK